MEIYKRLRKQMLVGRPSKFTQEIADLICARLADGESLRKITSDEDMPDRRTVDRWLNINQEFAAQYVRAREAQADTIFDECLDIADDARNDFITKLNGEKVIDNEAVQRSRLRIDTRKWMAGKLRPKKYGDKFTAEHTGEVMVVITGDDAKLV